jgi:hypothetical protein
VVCHHVSDKLGCAAGERVANIGTQKHNIKIDLKLCEDMDKMYVLQNGG